MDYLMYVVIVALVCAVGAYLIASQRGAANPVGWFFGGLLLGPIGLGLAMFTTQGPVKEPLTATSDRTYGPTDQAGTNMACGRCHKPLSPAWKGKCNHCGAPYAEYPPLTRRAVFDASR